MGDDAHRETRPTGTKFVLINVVTSDGFFPPQNDDLNRARDVIVTPTRIPRVTAR